MTMTFTKSRAPLVLNYEIIGTPIERVSKFKDLDVIFDPKGFFC